VAAHHRRDRREIGGAAGCGVEDGRELAEVLGAEDARGDHRKRSRVHVLRVVEVVNCAAGDEDGLADATSVGT
jgi:hypothetical protein